MDDCCGFVYAHLEENALSLLDSLIHLVHIGDFCMEEVEGMGVMLAFLQGLKGGGRVASTISS